MDNKQLGLMPRFAALMVITIGLLVIMGWHLHLPELFQLRADFSPMQYNTALGFVLIGTALFSIIFNQPRWTQIFSLIATLLGGLTLFQYLTQVDLGIDQLLMQHYVTTHTSNPGRMAPNTALCFLLSGAALALITKHRPLESSFLVIIVIILSVIPLSGYVFGVESAYGWANLSRMAPHTASSFVMFSLGMLAAIRDQRQMQFTRLSIHGRMAIGFAAMLMITLAVGLTSLVRIDSVSALTEKLERHAFRVSNAALAMKINTIQINRSMKNLVLYTSTQEKQRALEDIASQERAFDINLQVVRGNYLGSPEDIDSLKTSFQQWRLYGKESVRLLNEGRADLFSIRTLNDGNQMAATTELMTDRIIRNTLGDAQMLIDRSRNARKDAFNLMLILLGAAVLLAIAVSLYITRSIRNQLLSLSTSMGLLTDGNTDSTIPYQDDQYEIGHMARAVNVFKGYLRERNLLQERTRLIVENSPSGLLMVDRDGRIGMVNRKFEQLFAYSRDEILGQTMECLLPERYRATHPGQRASFFSSPSARGMGSDMVLFARRKDGSEFPVEIGLNPVDSNEGTMVLASIVDVSERHAAEHAARENNERLARHAEALERTNKELDTFAYVASHDLKSPLRGIDQLATWITEDIGETTPETQNNLRLMRVRVNRMEGLLNDLLAYSRVGRQAYNLETVSIGTLVENIFGMLSHPESIRLEVHEPMPTFVTLRVPLELVLRNLINNAIKHHNKPQGTITVSASLSEDRYTFTVADDGPGIAAEHQERVFGIFQTLRPRDDVEGSGMGLAIVKKTIEYYGGVITLISDGSSGSRFQFTWPNEATMRRCINEDNGG